MSKRVTMRWERHNLERQNQIWAAAVELLEEGPAGAWIPFKHIAERSGLAKSGHRSRTDGARGADGKVAPGRRGAGRVAGTKLGAVLAEGHIADVVQGFHGPMTADHGRESGRVGRLSGQAGDRRTRP
ncbi:hypothetical protein ACFWDI_28085 [Streptomyces sp. NPDC060064]|uniref:hypothetical protein n=1 Tax=Streptomyces sp. NPDC060064 TaxID=3347049 RepID=UPI0036C14DF9